MYLSLQRAAGLLIFALALNFTCASQGMDAVERSRMKDMLKTVKTDVRKNYYDESFHGLDLEERFQKAADRLDQVKSSQEGLGAIAQTLIDFNDSHLFFIPPPASIAVEYGWRMAAVDDKVFITALKPGSDGDKKGLKVGDQVLAVNGFKLSRRELWKIQYYYNAISRRNALALDVVSPGSAEPRHLEVASEIMKIGSQITFDTYFKLDQGFYYEENYKHRFYKVGGIDVWHMPDFDMTEADVDNAVNHLDRQAPLVLDLRGNGGGSVKALEELVGFFFDKDVQIADLKGRKKMDPMLAKTHKKDLLTGKLVVLVDGESASAAEIFAHLIQLEKRGVVLGDRSAGAVMQAEHFDEKMGTDSIVIYGVSVTNADVIMSDGKSLEHVGVVPDEFIIPSAGDLAANRDPVLARAIELLGGKIDPAEAGKMTNYYWK